MSEELSENESFSRHLTGRRRVWNAVRGIIPASIAVPLILQVWSPIWFVVSWLVTYLVVSSLFLCLVAARPSGRVEQTWSIAVSLVFCAVPVSSVTLSSRPEDYWAAFAVAIVFIAFEMSSLPFLLIGEWRVGVLLVGLSVVVSGLFTIHPIVALSLAPVLLSMVHSTDRIRQLKIELERNVDAAERTIRHDPLTGLLNRRGLASVLEQLSDREITIALIDVDRFKSINDTHGHQAGDQVLVALATELRVRFGGDAHLARLGGDEFVAVVPDAALLDESLALPVSVDVTVHGQAIAVQCGLSIGIARGSNVDAAQRLLSQAGFAMRESKRGGGKLSRFGDALSERLDRTIEIAAIANGSGAGGTFVPVGQAITSDDRIVGCEMLIRWERVDGTTLLPAKFLPMAVEAGLMSTINDVMLEHAIRFAARFNNRPEAPFVSVNISAPHLGAASFCSRVEALLRKYRVPPARLMIEITEAEQLGRYGGWESAASQLRAIGVRSAGYSSIERLQHLPISHLKFDRTLVRAVSGPFGQIVRGVTGFAKAVNIGVIAEGIETLDQYESMRAFDIAMFQGFYFHEPEVLDALEVRIIEDRVRAAPVSERSVTD